MSGLKYAPVDTPRSTFMYRGQPCQLLTTGVDLEAERVVSLVLRLEDGIEIEVIWNEEEDGFPGVTYEMLQ